MDTITKFLNNISYKFPKGYPDINDPNDFLILENELKHLGINLHELAQSDHYTKRKNERIKITDIPNLSQKMVGDNDLSQVKEKIIKDITQELSKRLTYLENIKNIPTSYTEQIVYKTLKPVLLSDNKKYDLQFTTEAKTKSGDIKGYTNSYYVTIISDDTLLTLRGMDGDDQSIIQSVIDHNEKTDKESKPVNILTLSDFEYIISLDEIIKPSTIDPAELPYKIRTDYRKGADFIHDVYGKGTIVDTSTGAAGKGDNRGKLDWVEVDFKKPYLSGGKLKTTRIVNNIYTTVSPLLSQDNG